MRRQLLSLLFVVKLGVGALSGPAHGLLRMPRRTPTVQAVQDSEELPTFSGRPLPPASEWYSASGLSLEAPDEQDFAMIEGRHLGHAASMVGVGRRCRHGCPQAFVWEPEKRHSSRKDKFPLEGGLFRLSCPLLVKAVDEWEAEGAVNELNAAVTGRKEFGRLQRPLLANTSLPAAAASTTASADVIGAGGTGTADDADANDDATALARLLGEAHHGHALARLALLGEERVRSLLEEYPFDHAYGPNLRLVLQSGIAGHVPGKVDVKCVHAQLADYLCRSGTNGVGASRDGRLCGDCA